MVGENGWPLTPEWSLPPRDVTTYETATTQPLAAHELDGLGDN